MVRKVFVLICVIYTQWSAPLYASNQDRRILIDAYDGLIELTDDSLLNLCDRLIQTSQDHYALALANYHVGYIKKSRHDLNAAAHYIEGIHLLEEADTSDVFLEMSFRKNLGVLFKQYGDIDSGIRYYLEAIPFATAYDKLRPFEKQTHVMSLKYNLANAYSENYNPKAIDLYLEILEDAKRKNVIVKIAQINNQLGVLFEEAKEYDLSIKHYKNVLTISREPMSDKLKLYLGYANQNLGETYLVKNDFDLAEQYLLASLDYLSGEFRFDPLVVLAEMYLKQGYRDQAKVYGERALSVYPEVQKSEEKLRIFELMATLSRTEEENANIYLTELLSEQKSLNKDLTTLANLKDKENLYRVVDSYYRELEANQRKSEYRQWIITGCAILVALIALVALYFMVMDKRKKRELSDLAEDGSSDFKYY